eukprot:6173027-Pyramimonas_sp.AAC.1
MKTGQSFRSVCKELGGESAEQGLDGLFSTQAALGMSTPNMDYSGRTTRSSLASTPNTENLRKIGVVHEVREAIIVTTSLLVLNCIGVLPCR